MNETCWTINDGGDAINDNQYIPWRPKSCYTLAVAVLIITLTAVTILLISSGNILVIIAVFFEPKLNRMRQNWLIVSLAVADILVGCLIMPLSLAYEIQGEWTFGWIMCELWLAFDVLFVTSSILNLCAISLDRYWSLTDPIEYPKKRTCKRMGLTVLTVWALSFLICLPPLVGWRPTRQPGQCTLSQDVSYVVYSALGSFYIPVTVLLIVYVRIFCIIKKRTKERMREANQRRTALNLTSLLSCPINAGNKKGPNITGLLRQYSTVQETPTHSDSGNTDIRNDDSPTGSQQKTGPPTKEIIRIPTLRIEGIAASLSVQKATRGETSVYSGSERIVGKNGIGAEEALVGNIPSSMTVLQQNSSFLITEHSSGGCGTVSTRSSFDLLLPLEYKPFGGGGAAEENDSTQSSPRLFRKDATSSPSASSTRMSFSASFRAIRNLSPARMFFFNRSVVGGRRPDCQSCPSLQQQERKLSFGGIAGSHVRFLSSFRLPRGRSSGRRDSRTATSSSSTTSFDLEIKERIHARQKLLKKKDRKATISLSLILGSFIASWLPFFLLYLLSSVGFVVSETVFDICFWLGYCNSALNPLIYTLMNPEFRSAFRKILRINKRKRRPLRR